MKIILTKNSKIKIKIMYNKKINKIKITENRFIYTNKELDYI